MRPILKYWRLAGILYFLLSGGWFSSSGLCSDMAFVKTQTLQGGVGVRSWKTLRDEQIVKQSLDYSCSAASLSVLINEYYGQSLTEEALLDAMDKEDGHLSFDDMQRALPQFGFRAVGYAASYEQLTRLKMPVVVYIEHRREEHFSVLRGIDEKTAWLADPSLGNRTYSREQFLGMWETRGKDSDNAHLKGRILAVLPEKTDIEVVDGFFTRSPARHSAAAVQQLLFLPMP